jgi:hypothetical protein
MKTYSFLVSVSNSTIIELDAENFEDAKKSALDRFYDSGIMSDLCNPGDMSVDIDLESEVEFKSVQTFMVGTRKEAEERCLELNKLLGVWRWSDFYVTSDEPNTQNPEDGERILCLSAEQVTTEEIKRLNLTEDFIIN